MKRNLIVFERQLSGTWLTECAVRERKEKQWPMQYFWSQRQGRIQHGQCPCRRIYSLLRQGLTPEPRGKSFQGDCSRQALRSRPLLNKSVYTLGSALSPLDVRRSYILAASFPCTSFEMIFPHLAPVLCQMERNKLTQWHPHCITQPPPRAAVVNLRPVRSDTWDTKHGWLSQQKLYLKISFSTTYFQGSVAFCDS